MKEQTISIAAAAKRLGLHRSTLSAQVASGAVRSHEGKVLFSEVLADRAKNIDLTRSGRRSGALDDVGSSSTADPTDAGLDPTDDGFPIIVDGKPMAYAEARALKETYAGLLRRLEYRKRAGELAEIEEVGREVEREYAIVRERFLTIPGKVAAQLVGLGRAEIERLLRAEVHEALSNLSSRAEGVA